MKFDDRKDAGQRLGERLRRFESERPLLLGLARGGVVVAAEAARVIGAEFDALVVRKVAPPGNREYGIGALAPEGVAYFDEAAVRATGISREELERRTEEEKAEMQRRIDVYRGGRPAPDASGRCAVVIDDGLATGVTAVAALRYVRTLGPAKVVLAVPVLSSAALSLTEIEADEVIFLTMPEPFRAVGDWYESFAETTDEEVRDLLAERYLGGAPGPAA